MARNALKTLSESVTQLNSSIHSAALLFRSNLYTPKLRMAFSQAVGSGKKIVGSGKKIVGSGKRMASVGKFVLLPFTEATPLQMVTTVLVGCGE